MSRRNPGPPRCHGCRAPIVFAGSPFASGRRPFNPRPLNGHALPAGTVAYPLFAGRAYRLVDLVDVLITTRHVGHDAAEKEARDLPWHSLHACDPTAAQEGKR